MPNAPYRGRICQDTLAQPCNFELANALINHPRLACRDQRRPFAAPCALAGHPRRAPAACAQNSSSSESATAGSTSRLRTRRSAAARSSSCSRARRTGSAAAADGRRCCGSPTGRQSGRSLAHRWTAGRSLAHRWTGVGCRRPCALQGPGPSSSMQPAPGQPDSGLRCCAAAAARPLRCALPPDVRPASAGRAAPATPASSSASTASSRRASTARASRRAAIRPRSSRRAAGSARANQCASNGAQRPASRLPAEPASAIVLPLGGRPRAGPCAPPRRAEGSHGARVVVGGARQRRARHGLPPPQRAQQRFRPAVPCSTRYRGTLRTARLREARCKHRSRAAAGRPGRQLTGGGAAPWAPRAAAPRARGSAARARRRPPSWPPARAPARAGPRAGRPTAGSRCPPAPTCAVDAALRPAHALPDGAPPATTHKHADRLACTRLFQQTALPRRPRSRPPGRHRPRAGRAAGRIGEERAAQAHAGAPDGEPLVALGRGVDVVCDGVLVHVRLVVGDQALHPLPLLLRPVPPAARARAERSRRLPGLVLQAQHAPLRSRNLTCHMRAPRSSWTSGPAPSLALPQTGRQCLGILAQLIAATCRAALPPHQILRPISSLIGGSPGALSPAGRSADSAALPSPDVCRASRPRLPGSPAAGGAISGLHTRPHAIKEGPFPATAHCTKMAQPYTKMAQPYRRTQYTCGRRRSSGACGAQAQARLQPQCTASTPLRLALVTLHGSATEWHLA